MQGESIAPQCCVSAIRSGRSQPTIGTGVVTAIASGVTVQR